MGGGLGYGSASIKSQGYVVTDHPIPIRKSEPRLTYRPEDNGHGQLHATVVSPPFAGSGSAWFTRETLKHEFISALREYPLSASKPPTIAGGFAGKSTGPGTPDQCHLRIVVKPYDARGSLLVSVHFASEFWDNSSKELQQSMTARFRVEYSAIDAFASEFEELLDGSGQTAILSGVVD